MKIFFASQHLFQLQFYALEPIERRRFSISLLNVWKFKAVCESSLSLSSSPSQKTKTGKNRKFFWLKLFLCLFMNPENSKICFSSCVWNQFKLWCLSFIESCIIRQRIKAINIVRKNIIAADFWHLFVRNFSISTRKMNFPFFFILFIPQLVSSAEFLACKSQVINQFLWLWSFWWLLWISSFN